MLDKKLLELLKSLRIKYYLNRLVKYISYSLILFSSAMLIIMILSRIFPITFILSKIVISLVISLLLGFIWSIINRPSYYETARLVDSLGLKERITTALELKGNSSKLAELQKKDAVDSLSKSDLKKSISLKPSMKILALALLLILSSIFVGFINTSSYEEGLIKEKNKNIIKNEIENIKKIEKNIQEEKRLTLEEKKQIESTLKELKKNLSKSDNLKDIQKQALKTKKELKDIENRLREEKIKEIAKKLSNKEFTKDLAESIKSKDGEELGESIKKMSEDIKNMNSEELKNVAQDLNALSEALKDNPELLNAFNQISDIIAQGIEGNIDNEKLANSLNSLAQSLDGLMNDSQVSGAISELNKALDNLTAATGKPPQSSNSNPTGQNPSGSGNQGSNSGGNQGGSGVGQGQGQGSGAGSGAGEGSSPGSESSSGSSGSGQSGKKEGSQKEVKDYESIFTPKNLGGDGEATQVHGNVNDTGDKDIIQVKKFGDMKGEAIPYNEVLNTYKENAYKRLDTEEIPPNMKEIIRKYFSELE